MPNDIYKLAVGDKYAVFHVALPDAYVCNNSDKSGASWDMFREAARFFYENTGELFTFKGELDGIWAKKERERSAAQFFCVAVIPAICGRCAQKGNPAETCPADMAILPEIVKA